MRHNRQSASLQGMQGRSMIFYHTSLVETRLLPLLRCHRRTNYTACHPTHSRTPCLEFFCAAKQGLDVCMLFLAGFLHLRGVAGPHELAESTSRPFTCNYLFGIRFGRFPSAESALGVASCYLALGRPTSRLRARLYGRKSSLFARL